MSIVPIVFQFIIPDAWKEWDILGNIQTLCSSVSAFRHNLCFTDIHTDNQKDLQELREEKLLFSSFFSGMDLLLSSGTGGVTGNAFVSSAAATKVDCLLLFLKSTLLFLTFLMRKHTVFKSFFCLKINFSNDSLRNCLFQWN